LCCAVNVIKKYQKEKKFKKQILEFIGRLVDDEEAGEEGVEYFVFGVRNRKKSEKKDSQKDF